MRATPRSLLPALAALALPGAAAAGGPCPVIGALLAENPKRLKGLGTLVNGAGRIDVTLNGAADALRGAESCDLSGPAEELGIRCSWNFAAGEDAQARRELQAVVGRLEACLPAPLDERPQVAYSEQQIADAARENGTSYADFLRNREVLADFDRDYPLGREGEHELSVSVGLVRYKDRGTVNLDVYLERR